MRKVADEDVDEQRTAVQGQLAQEHGVGEREAIQAIASRVTAIEVGDARPRAARRRRTGTSPGSVAASTMITIWNWPP